MIEIASAGRLPFLINLKDGGGPQASLVYGLTRLRCAAVQSAARVASANAQGR